MTVGFHAPLPPARTGVADYAAELLTALRRYGIVEPGMQAANVNLYHLGNNRLHRKIYFDALTRPGVVVLHDAVLNHFFLGTLNQTQYADEFAFNYGEWSRGEADDLYRNRARSAVSPKYFRYPMLRRIGERSRSVVVHNPAAAAMVKQHAAGARIVEIPHFWQSGGDADEWEAARVRERLGVSPGSYLFGVFGHLRETKRLMTLLRAFASVTKAAPSAALLIAGDCASDDLRRAMEPLLAGRNVIRIGYLTEKAFQAHARAVDACVNLRYPTAGETSGIAIRLMALGKPVIVSAGLETANFPDTACLRVDAGTAEQEILEAQMIWLANERAQGREIGRRAQAHIRSEHRLEKVAAQYWSVLERAQ